MHRLLSAVLIGLALGSAAARAEEPRELVVRAIRTHGGVEALTRLKAGQEKARGTLFSGETTVPLEMEVLFQLPDQYKLIMTAEIASRRTVLIEAFDRDRGWRSRDGKTENLSDKLLAELREMLHFRRVTRLVPLVTEDGFELTALGEKEVQGKPAVGVKVAAKDHRAVELYFGKASGLLVKTAHRVFDPALMKEVAQEEFLSDYQEVENAQMAMKVRVTKDGKKFLELEKTAVKVLPRLDDSVFNRP